MDLSAPLFAALGGACAGSFAVFIKTKNSVAVFPHPAIWTAYIGLMQFLLGVGFVSFRLVAGLQPTFVWSWWGVASAASFAPASFCLNSAVPLIGVGTAGTVQAAGLSLLSFLLGWLVLGEEMRTAEVGGHSVTLAPVFFACAMPGLFVLAIAPFLGGNTRITIVEPPEEEDPLDLLASGRQPARRRSISFLEATTVASSIDPYQFPSDLSLMSRSRVGSAHSEASMAGARSRANSSGSPPVAGMRRRMRTMSDGAMQMSEKAMRNLFLRQAMGMGLALLSACFATVLFGAVNVAKTLAMRRASCKVVSECPPEVAEAFNNFGSWSLSHGISCLIVCGLMLLGVAAKAWCAGQPPVLTKVCAVAPAGCAVGLISALGNLFINAAVISGGSAVMTPAAKAVAIIVSGAWAILYYKEFGGWRASVWCIAAIWTIGFLVLLGFQKVE